MTNPTDEIIAELKAKHGADLMLVELPNLEQSFVIKPPTREVWRRFRVQIGDVEKRGTAMEALVIQCVVWPARETFDAMVNAKPAIIESISGEISGLAGVDKDATSKKL